MLDVIQPWILSEKDSIPTEALKKRRCRSWIIQVQELEGGHAYTLKRTGCPTDLFRGSQKVIHIERGLEEGAVKSCDCSEGGKAVQGVICEENRGQPKQYSLLLFVKCVRIEHKVSFLLTGSTWKLYVMILYPGLDLYSN